MSKSSNIKLTYGREHLAIPGPSNIPQRVLQAMNRPAPNIYGKEIELVTEGVREGIAKFANTDGKTIIYVSNGHGVWEASLVNLFRPNDSVLLCSTGHFGYKWGIIAKRLGLNIVHIDTGFNTIIDPTQIEEPEGARGGLGPNGVRIHSVRMRGMTAHQEVILGAQGQTLIIRQDSYDRTSFMPGVVLACKKIQEASSLTIGLDALL